MIILRVLIDDIELKSIYWQLTNTDEGTNESSNSNFSQILTINFDKIEIYLSPLISVIFKVELGAISDKKLTDELLLGFVEEFLAEDLDNCKPILMRIEDGFGYIAIVNKKFYEELVSLIQEIQKKIQFIQPIVYTTSYQEGLWTVNLLEKNKYIRTSLYEYYLLDDEIPIPLLLNDMLLTYNKSQLILYSDNQEIKQLIESKYNLVCITPEEVSYGNLVWNFYNEKTKRFNVKLNKITYKELAKLFKIFKLAIALGIAFWLINVIVLLGIRTKIATDIKKNIGNIPAFANVNYKNSNVLEDKLTELRHQKGIYAAGDMITLMNLFLDTVPEVGNDQIIATKYDHQQLSIFLNSKFDPNQFASDKSILITKRITADLIDYKAYLAENSSKDNKSNNSSNRGLLDANSNDTNNINSLTNASYVITLKTISLTDISDDFK